MRFGRFCLDPCDLVGDSSSEVILPESCSRLANANDTSRTRELKTTSSLTMCLGNQRFHSPSELCTTLRKRDSGMKVANGFSGFFSHTLCWQGTTLHLTLQCRWSVHPVVCPWQDPPVLNWPPPTPPANSTQLNWKYYTLFVMAVWINC